MGWSFDAMVRAIEDFRSKISDFRLRLNFKVNIGLR